MGHYGPIVIDPAGVDPVQLRPRACDRPVGSQSDAPACPCSMKRLKQRAGYFNYQKQTLAGLLKRAAISHSSERMDWGKMRMDPTDVSDVTGSTYSFLVNGHGPA
jgi:FtsP/CotA-like multicopper oxidase with cupredoxin domain